MKDLYDRLGLAREATPEEIKRAYRKRAAQYHPDKPGGCREKFQEIQEAYEILSDPAQRKQYDETGEVGTPMWMKVLLGLFEKALSEADERTDLVQWVRNQIKGGMRDAELAKVKMERDIEKLKAMLPNLTGPLLVKMIEGKIAQGERSLLAMAADREIGRVMLEKIKNYRHTVSEPPPKVAGAYGETLDEAIRRRGVRMPEWF